MTKQLSILEQLCYSTTRIECEAATGQSGTGTGFFFNLQYPENKNVPVVITNRHVAEGMTKGRFRLTKADAEGNPMHNQHFMLDFSVDFEKMWTFHPDPLIDLCAMPIAQLLTAAQKLNSTLFLEHLTKP